MLLDRYEMSMVLFFVIYFSKFPLLTFIVPEKIVSLQKY
jgi:hypothetical protein